MIFTRHIGIGDMPEMVKAQLGVLSRNEKKVKFCVIFAETLRLMVLLKRHFSRLGKVQAKSRRDRTGGAKYP